MGLLVAMVFTLRSRRIRERLYETDDPEVVVRRFEVAVYCAMCLGTALVLLGLVVAAT